VTERAKQLTGTVPADAFDVAVDMLTREQRRSRRKREVRARTISTKRMSKRALREGALELRELGVTRAEYETMDDLRPRTRGDCEQVARPCPFVSCRFHLFVDVSPRSGAIKLNFPDLEPDELLESCSLDVADRGGETLENVGQIINVTRERVRQVEVLALRRLQVAQLKSHVDVDDTRTPVRKLPEEP
jgi:hypothetical protein